jgi:hypothetical protein
VLSVRRNRNTLAQEQVFLFSYLSIREAACGERKSQVDFPNKERDQFSGLLEWAGFWSFFYWSGVWYF